MTNEVEETTVQCPIDGCNSETAVRGLHMHVYHTDDPEGQGHYPRWETPPDFEAGQAEDVGSKSIEYDFPDNIDLEETEYFDTYTGKAYQGKRGLMIHLGQMAGRENIPEFVTEKHDAEDFPIVSTDPDGNIVEVLREGSNSVPPIEPYLPWVDDTNTGYIPKKEVKAVIEEVEKTNTGVISAEKLKEKLLTEA